MFNDIYVVVQSQKPTNAYAMSLVPTNLVIITVLVAFQTTSWMKLTKYGNETLDYPIPFHSFGIFIFLIIVTGSAKRVLYIAFLNFQI